MKMFAWAFMVYIIEDEITDQIKKKKSYDTHGKSV